MRTIATAAFLASAATTGVSVALMQWFVVQQAVWTMMLGIPTMVVASGIMLGTPNEDPDARMARNQIALTLGRPEIGPVARPRPNGYSRTWPATSRRAG